MTMRLRSVIVLPGLLLLVPLVARPGVLYVQQGEGKAVPSAQQESRATATDQQVLDAVLRDLLKDPELGNLSRKRIGGSGLVLIKETPPWSPGGIGAQGERHRPGMVPMSMVSESLREAMMARNIDAKDSGAEDNPRKKTVRRTWAGYKPFGTEVLVAEHTADELRKAHYDDWFWKQYPKAKGFVWAWLPGYTADGNTALVEFVVGPAPESLGIYVLTKQRGMWRVKEHYLGSPPL
jgi:hypothetical protein